MSGKVHPTLLDRVQKVYENNKTREKAYEKGTGFGLLHDIDYFNLGNWGKKMRGRKSRIIKLNARKSRGRKSRGRKSRGRKH